MPHTTVVRGCQAVVSGSSFGRIPSVDGARGIAMVLVFSIHLLELFARLAPTGTVGSKAIAYIYPLGQLAGLFFVVITGCFLYASLLKQPVRYTAFLRRRLVRIYSVYAVVFGAYLALSYIFPSESKLPPDRAAAIVYIFRNLLLLPGVFPSRPVITVSWTISYIVLYCIALPPILQYSGMRQWQQRKRVMFFSAIAGALALVAHLTQVLPAQLSLLPLGTVVHEALLWRQTHPRQYRWLEPLALSASGIALVMRYVVVHRAAPAFQGEIQLLITAVVLGCACFGIFSSEARFSGWLCAWHVQSLGRISYSYYLTHSLTIKLLGLVLPGFLVLALQTAPGFYMLLPACFGASLLPASILYFFVEKPSRKLAVSVGSGETWPLLRRIRAVLQTNTPLPLDTGLIAVLAGIVLVSYGIPTLLETMLLHTSQTVSAVLASDSIGCAMLALFFWRIQRATLLYLGLTAVECAVLWLHLAKMTAIAYFSDAIPTLIMCGYIVYGAAKSFVSFPPRGAVNPHFSPLGRTVADRLGPRVKQ